MGEKWKNIYILSIMNIEKIGGHILKNLFIFLNIFAVLLLTACGGNKYDDAIDNVIKKYKNSLIEDGYDTDDVKRDNAVIRVYDGGNIFSLLSTMMDRSIIPRMITMRRWGMIMKKWSICLQLESMIV